MPARGMATRRLVAVAVVVGLAVLPGCEDADGSDPVTSGSSGSSTDPQGFTVDEELSDELRRLSRQRDSARLTDLVDIEWDAVHVFSEGATADEVEQAVGQPVLTSERYLDAGNLLVFVRDDVVTRSVSVLPDLLSTGSDTVFGPAVRVVPFGSGTPSLLRLAAG